MDKDKDRFFEFLIVTALVIARATSNTFTAQPDLTAVKAWAKAIVKEYKDCFPTK